MEATYRNNSEHSTTQTVLLTDVFNQSHNASTALVSQNKSSNDKWTMNNDVGSLLTEPPRIIALVLGFVAISLNVMSLLALLHVKHKTKTHIKLVASLAVSDIVIGVSVILHFVTTVVNPNYYPGFGPAKGRLISRCTFIFTKALNSMGLNISLLNMTAMAMDHYKAITEPLKYLPNNRKSGLVIGIMWVVAIILGFSDFFTGNRVYQRRKPLYNYCEAVYLSLYQDEYTVFVVGLTTSVIMLCIYIRIYCFIKSHQLPGESCSYSLQKPRIGCKTTETSMQVNRQSNPRSGKALRTTLLILGTFFLCWAPNCLYQVGLIIQVKQDPTKLMSWTTTLYLLDQYFLDLLLLNSAIDPVIYAIRMREVQLGYRRMFQRCFKKCPSFGNGPERRSLSKGMEDNISRLTYVSGATELKPLN